MILEPTPFLFPAIAPVEKPSQATVLKGILLFCSRKLPTSQVTKEMISYHCLVTPILHSLKVMSHLINVLLSKSQIRRESCSVLAASVASEWVYSSTMDSIQQLGLHDSSTNANKLILGGLSCVKCILCSGTTYVLSKDMITTVASKTKQCNEISWIIMWCLIIMLLISLTPLPGVHRKFNSQFQLCFS